MRFKPWISSFFNELFVPGTHYNRPQDITNVGLGVGSKYISPEEAGVKNNTSPIDTADFGIDTKEEKEKEKERRKLRKLRQFQKIQRRNI